MLIVFHEPMVKMMLDETNMIKQYAVYTLDPTFLKVYTWLVENEIKMEPHLNRTRFWIIEGPLLTEFLLRWGQSCPPVEEVPRNSLY